MNNQVTTIEQYNELIKLGFEVEESMYSMVWQHEVIPWLESKDQYFLKDKNDINIGEEDIPAFTLTDLLKLLTPYRSKEYNNALFVPVLSISGDNWICSYENIHSERLINSTFCDKEPLQAVYKTFIWRHIDNVKECK